MIKDSRKKARRNQLISGIILIVLVIGTAIGLSIFASSPKHSESPNVQIPPVIIETTNTAPDIRLPLQDLNGNWKANIDSGATMTAVVQNGKIEITLNNVGAKMFYWVGTFEALAGSGEVVISDKVEIRKAVLSGSTNKQFYIGDESITFDLVAMGNTTQVTMRRG